MSEEVNKNHVFSPFVRDRSERGVAGHVSLAYSITFYRLQTLSLRSQTYLTIVILFNKKLTRFWVCTTWHWQLIIGLLFYNKVQGPTDVMNFSLSVISPKSTEIKIAIYIYLKRTLLLTLCYVTKSLVFYIITKTSLKINKLTLKFNCNNYDLIYISITSIV